MDAISLWQPWAQWVMLGYKKIETRYHDRFKGLVGKRIAIHAAQAWDKYALDIASNYAAISVFKNLNGLVRYRRGKLLGTVHVEDGFWGVGQPNHNQVALCPTERVYCLVLIDPDPLPFPKPFSGKQGIFKVPDEIMKVV